MGTAVPIGSPTRAVGAVVATGVLALVVVGAPTVALAHEPESGCDVVAGELVWGVKESFRSYISSSIANGSWEVADGATYSTPSFSWVAAAGAIDPSTGLGEVSFTGTVSFTGHGGLLHLELRDPVIHIDDDGATLLLDVLSNDPDGAVAIDEQDVVFATLPAEVMTGWDAGGTRSWEAIEPIVLTEAGAAAFGGFYAEGDELDPVALEVALDEDCRVDAADANQQLAGGVIGGIVAASVLAIGGVVAAVASVSQRRRR